jgi:hypothetical protein
MTRFQVVSLPFVPALLAWAAVPSPQAHGQLSGTLETIKIFRQYASNDTTFLSGKFNIDVSDGLATYQAGCYDFDYFPPLIGCEAGATGFVGFGNPDPYAQEPYNYYMITGVQAATTLEPRREDLCLLKFAPYSTLPRPQPGFEDTSFSVYYDISPASIEIREYTVTRYGYHRTYKDSKGGQQMRDEIVPGTYGFTFPRLGNPILPVAMPMTFSVIPDGYGEIKGTKIKQGVRFISPSEFDKHGFTQIDRNQIPNVQWEGLNTSSVTVCIFRCDI